MRGSSVVSTVSTAFILQDGMIAVTLDPRVNKIVVFSYENEDILKREYQSLCLTGRDSKEVSITIDLPHGQQLSTFVTLRLDGYGYQTTHSLTAHNVSTQPGMRSFRFCMPGESINVSKNRFGEFRFADQPSYECVVYKQDYLQGNITQCQVIDTRMPRTDHQDVAEPANTKICWKLSSTTLENHSGIPEKRFEELLHGNYVWKILAIAYSQEIEDGWKIAGRPPIELTHGVINVTITYVGSGHATQTVTGMDEKVRIQILRRELVSDEDYDSIVSGEEDKEQCVICMFPILTGQECSDLPCVHNKNIHAFCSRHTVKDDILQCSICRETVQCQTTVFASGFGCCDGGR